MFLQIEAQSTPAESSQPENVEAQASNSPEPGGPCLDPQTDAHPAPAEGTEPETAEPQTTTSPQKDSVPEDSLDSLPDSFTPKKPKEKQRASPRPEQPQRRSTRRQLELEASPSPEPYGKRLRSSATSAEKVTSSPQSAKKTNKTAAKPAFQKHTTADQPPAKRARGKNEAAAAESQQQESEEATVSETPQPGLSFLSRQ